MKQILLVLAFFVATNGLSLAQTKTQKRTTPAVETLTNQSIISLAKAGLSKDLIISKIQSSQATFDLSTNALIALSKESIDNDIIKAMMVKSSGATVQIPQPAQSSKDALPSLEMINHIYQYDKPAGKVIPLEKSQASMKTKMKAFGYGGANVMYVIDGEKSPVRVVPADAATFVVNTGGAAPEFTLYKLTSNKKTRETVTQKAGGMFSGNNAASSGGNTLNYSVTMLKTGVYQLTPGKLDKGEYLFAVKPTLSASSIDIYAFGID